MQGADSDNSYKMLKISWTALNLSELDQILRLLKRGPFRRAKYLYFKDRSLHSS